MKKLLAGAVLCGSILALTTGAVFAQTSAAEYLASSASAPQTAAQWDEFWNEVLPPEPGV